MSPSVVCSLHYIWLIVPYYVGFISQILVAKCAVAAAVSSIMIDCCMLHQIRSILLEEPSLLHHLIVWCDAASKKVPDTDIRYLRRRSNHVIGWLLCCSLSCCSVYVGLTPHPISRHEPTIIAVIFDGTSCLWRTAAAKTATSSASLRRPHVVMGVELGRPWWRCLRDVGKDLQNGKLGEGINGGRGSLPLPPLILSPKLYSNRLRLPVVGVSIN